MAGSEELNIPFVIIRRSHMACFLVPAAEAVVITVVDKTLERKEEKAPETTHAEEVISTKESEGFGFRRKLRWLSALLWGGSFLLLFEHIWHGEVVPWFPFLTAMSNAADTEEMLHEMSTVGVAMAALITLVWVGMVIASSYIEKRAPEKSASEA